MIGKLTGKIIHINSNQIIIDVNGIGYMVYATSANIADIQLNQDQSFWIHSQVKEGKVTLFGFLTRNEQQIFETLITIQGVGGKVALSVLSSLTTETVTNAIIAQDITAFKKVTGVGPKLAARIVNELKDKKSLFAPIKNRSLTNNNTEKDIFADAISALSNLEFSKSDAFKIVNDILRAEAQINFEDLMKKALNQITK